MRDMQAPGLDKITVHIGVGESGERLSKAEKILEAIVKQKTVRTLAKKTLPAFGIKKREPIGCKVTLRGEKAEDFLKTALGTLGNRLSLACFDQMGNFSFGIEEHTDFPGMKYDPSIGIYGMDISASLKRAGFRISRRSIQQKKIPRKQRITREEAIKFLREKYGVEVA